MYDAFITMCAILGLGLLTFGAIFASALLIAEELNERNEKTVYLFAWILSTIILVVVSSMLFGVV